MNRLSLYSLTLFLALWCLTTCNITQSPDIINCPGRLPESPYDSPIWHPGGKFIGFNYWPLDTVIAYGPPCDEGRIVFEHYSTAGFWLVNADGTDMRRVLPYMLLTPDWSPDGQWVAYKSKLNGSVSKVPFSGGGFDTTAVFRLIEGYDPDWSPDGEWIACSGIWIMRADGSDKQFVFSANDPVWHPDGQSILGIRNINGGQGFVKFYPFESMPAETLIVNVGHEYRNPEYSPGGERISFWSMADDGSTDLWVMNSDGSNLRLMQTGGILYEGHSWSPDGSKIVYTRFNFQGWSYINGTIWTVDVETGEKNQLTFNPEA